MKKIIAKLAVTAALAAGAAFVTVAPASAQVRFGVTLGAPGYYGYNNYSCDPYSRFYDPYRCGYGYGYGYGAPYYGPSFYLGGGSRYYGRSYYGGGYNRGSSYRGGGGSHSGGSHHR